MEDIQVGEFIRTIDGYIRKVTQVNKKGSYEGLCYGAYSLDKKYKNSVGVSAKKILKHSKNIIDLIEAGDYVNGSVVIDLDDLGYLDLEDDTIKYDDIKSVVTKEQFNRIKYIVEE